MRNGAQDLPLNSIRLRLGSTCARPPRTPQRTRPVASLPHFRKRFMPSRSMMARQLYSVSSPRIPLILVAPCRKAKPGSAAAPNFSGGTLKSPILRSLICAALTGLVRVGKYADTRVGSEEIPSDLKNVSGKVVINAPVSTSNRPYWP